MTFPTMDSQGEPKKGYVPLEEALDAAGIGLYTGYVMVVAGLVQFSATSGIQVMANIIPAASCDLALTGFEKGLLTSSAFSGMIFSSLVSGSLADLFGRRTTILFCSSMNAVLAIVASIAPNFTILAATWLLNGFLLGGVFSSIFVYVTEFCPIRIRAKSILLPTCLASLAAIYLPSMGWLILPLDISIPIYGSLVLSSWRLFFAVVTIPTVLSTFLLYMLPESPKFTLNKGNEEETLRTLRSMFALNQKKSKSEYPISSVCLDLGDRIALPKTSEKSNFVVGMLRSLIQQFVTLFTPPLLFYTVLSCFMLCGFVALYNGLFLWLPEQMKVLMHHYVKDNNYRATLCQVLSTGNETDIGGNDSSCTLNEDIFIIGCITAALQSVSLVAVSFLADRFGRKPFTVISSIMTMGACITLMYVNDFMWTVIFYCVTVIILCVSFPVALSIVVDFFPTSFRSSAVSITMMFGRLGASGGSQIYGALYQNHCEELYWGIIAIMASNVVLSIFAPSKRKL